MSDVTITLTHGLRGTYVEVTTGWPEDQRKSWIGPMTPAEAQSLISTVVDEYFDDIAQQLLF